MEYWKASHNSTLPALSQHTGSRGDVVAAHYLATEAGLHLLKRCLAGYTILLAVRLPFTRRIRRAGRKTIHTARVLVELLKEYRVEHIFGKPGDTTLPMAYHTH